MKAPTLKETLVDTRTALGVLEEGGVPDYVVYVSHPADPTPLFWQVAIAQDYVPGGERMGSWRIPDRGVSFRVKPSG